MQQVNGSESSKFSLAYRPVKRATRLGVHRDEVVNASAMAAPPQPRQYIDHRFGATSYRLGKP